LNDGFLAASGRGGFFILLQMQMPPKFRRHRMDLFVCNTKRKDTFFVLFFRKVSLVAAILIHKEAYNQPQKPYANRG